MPPLLALPPRVSDEKRENFRVWEKQKKIMNRNLTEFNYMQFKLISLNIKQAYGAIKLIFHCYELMCWW